MTALTKGKHALAHSLKTTQINAYDDAVVQLTHLGPLRVWSLLVTVFGDLAPSGPLEGPVISAIMAEIGIKPEATRVALHRLRTDGWIVSQKTGRTSQHQLSAKGRAGSDAARSRIYPKQDEREDVYFALVPDEVVPDPAVFAQVSPRLFVAPAGVKPPRDCLLLEPGQLPSWLQTSVETEELRAGYNALYAVLSALDLPHPSALGALRTAVLRILIVHAWRRLVLKHPWVPPALCSDEWRGPACKALVSKWLDHLSRPSLTEL